LPGIPDAFKGRLAAGKIVIWPISNLLDPLHFLPETPTTSHSVRPSLFGNHVPISYRIYPPILMPLLGCPMLDPWNLLLDHRLHKNCEHPLSALCAYHRQSFSKKSRRMSFSSLHYPDNELVSGDRFQLVAVPRRGKTIA
jgi:hypothetical protein